MVDFNKKFHNTDKFRQAALTFQKTGKYCAYPNNTQEYFAYWDQETDRCLNGYTAEDGDWISGYDYFYLNYCPIQRIVNHIETVNGKIKVTRKRELEFPDFWDYDAYFFYAVEDAETVGKHMCVLKSRRKGFSYKAASMCCRNYYLIPGSKSYVYASNKQYLTEDGTLTKAWDYMNFIDKHTAWGKKRSVNTTMRKRSGFFTTDEYGNQVEMGYQSEIIGVTLKDNPDICRGKAAKLILFEEAGSFSELGAAWEIARPSVEVDSVAFGLMLAFGTGGDEGSNFETLRSMFYNPEGYNCIQFDNIWDDVATKPCGFFCPQYTNMDIRDENGKRIYMDDDGNTLRDKSIAFLLEERRKIMENAKTSESIDRYVAEHCLTPSEACLDFKGNIFPKKELQQQLARIRTNKTLQNAKQVGDLVFDANNQLQWIQKQTGDIDHYPLNKDDDPTGSIVIWEHPNKDAAKGLYIAGCLTPNQKVFTDRGYINVQDVSLENKLLNKDGNFVDIINLQRYFKVDESIYKIRMSHAFSTTTFTQEHPLYVAEQRTNSYTGRIDETKFDFKFVKAKDVKPGQWTIVPNKYIEERTGELDNLWQDFGRIDRVVKSPLNNKEFWWFIGLWLGDGYCSSNGYSINVIFDNQDVEYKNRFIRFVQSVLNRKVYFKDGHGCTTGTFSYQYLNHWLTKYFGKYAYGKHIPEFVKYMKREYKTVLLQGYLDSDGCVYECGKYYITGFVSMNLRLLEDIQDICLSLGLAANLTKLRNKKESVICGKISQVQEAYQLRMAYHDSLLFKQLVNNEDRKLDKIKKVKIRRKPKDGCFFSKDLKFIYYKIREIEVSKYTGWVYNFECDTHTFVCRHISTHNCDSYDFDQSTTTSLGSCFIYKRFQNFEEYSDIIVAEYTGRPASANDFYENVRKLLLYYNATAMYENQNKGIFVYLSNKGFDYLLADQPDILLDQVGLNSSKVQRKKGCHMNQQIKTWAFGLIKDWLNELDDKGVKNLNKIMSEPFLEELIKCTEDSNVDRIMAYCQVMIYRQQLMTLQTKEEKEETKRKALFDGPLFTDQWFADDTFNNQIDDIPTFTFNKT